MANSNNYDSFDNDEEYGEDLELDLPDTPIVNEEVPTVEKFIDGLDEDDNAEAIMMLQKADRMVKKYTDLVNAVKPTTAEDEKAAKDFSTWRKAVKPATIFADTSELDAIIDNPESTKEDLCGVIRLLDKLRNDAENTLQSKYNLGRVNSRPTTKVPAGVDLVAERKKLIALLDSIEGMAQNEIFAGLTTERLYSCPNVSRKTRKVKDSNETRMTWDVPMAPRADSDSKWTGVRSNNSTMKLVIDGEVPANHPFWIGDAVRELLGMSIRQYRILAGDVWENNDNIFDWTDTNGVTHKIGQRKVQS